MARIKYYDQASQEWKYADTAFGVDGRTPVKGEDYFTEEDKQEMTEHLMDKGMLTYNEQSLTDEQKIQARKNIGIDEDELVFKDHIQNKENPHGVTAEQIGALPSTGGKMTGDINMNGQKLNGLNAPTEDDEAATKGYAVAKENVVNNFTTTEAGFVADARAVQVLNNKLETIESENVALISAFPDTTYVTVKRLTYIGNLASIRIDIGNFSVSIDAGATFATITKKPRIGQVVFMTGMKDGQNVAGSAYISTNGEIQTNFSSGTWTYINVFGTFLL